jgi:hypothetical protein
MEGGAHVDVEVHIFLITSIFILSVHRYVQERNLSKDRGKQSGGGS